MNYCSHCGSSDLTFAIPPGDNKERFICQSCGTIHYSNPNIVTGCLPIWEDKVLLCKRAIEPRVGFWNVPGGYLENGESVEEGAIREVWEEAGAKVEILNMHTLYSIPRINQVYIHFLGQLSGPDHAIGEESLEARFFTEDEIPWEEIAFASSTYTLKRYFEDRAKGQHQLHRTVLRF